MPKAPRKSTTKIASTPKAEAMPSAEVPVTTTAPKVAGKPEPDNEPSKINFESTVDVEEAVAYFEAIAVGLKKGTLTFRQGSGTMQVSPTRRVDLTVKASKKADKGKIVFEIAWKSSKKEAFDIS